MRRAAAGIFFALFALYLWHMPPGLASYRDAGEFALSAHTLGVSHPPSYPVYVLLGRLFDVLPVGTPATSLAVLSAAAGAGAAALLFLILAPRLGAAAAAAGAVLLGTNGVFWDVASVQEMYSLTILFAVVLYALAERLRVDFSARLWYLAAFLFGLFLGNRTDLLLWMPGLLLLSLPATFRRAPIDEKIYFFLKTAAFGALGLSVYLYLPLRSSQGPWLDWNHPAELSNFFGSITRKGYGGTLDLLSRNYKTGAMFLPNLKVYALHLWRDLTPIGLLLAAGGIWARSRGGRRIFLGEVLLYLASGPLFLFLANLPPNPHAMAIVEPHYLLSDLVLIIWAAVGAAFVAERVAGPSRVPGAAVLALVLASPWAMGRRAEMDRRWDLFSYDWTRNVLRSTPEASILVAKKDVQIFNLWYHQRILGWRPDVHLVAQGLSHSPWHQASLRRFGSPLRLWNLRSRDGWARLKEDNPGKRIFGTMDVEFNTGETMGAPTGLAAPVFSVSPPSERPWEFLVRRGDFRYEARPDFFTKDLIASYTVARQRLGAVQLKAGLNREVERSLIDGWRMKRLNPEIATMLGYLRYRNGDLRGAERAYAEADRLYAEMIALTEEYHSLPELKTSIRNAAADTRMNFGVVYEKLGRKDAAEQFYRGSLELNPNAARPHYNIAVLHWHKDWPKVVRELRAALAIDPNDAQSKRYLSSALRQQAKEKK
ncbi:MAG: DUF2723 domain-containing protein [Elusimicrobiota bacterium]